MSTPEPSPINMTVCSVCGEPWSTDLRKVYAADDVLRTGPWVWNVPTVIDCIGALKIRNQGPTGPVGPEGVAGRDAADA